jgi:hypothetical protein
MNKESFLIYKSFYEPLKGLSDEDMGIIFRAIFEYQIYGKSPEISPILNMAFSFIKDVLDRDNLKYLAIVERNQNNGKNGGRPNKKPKKPSGLSGIPKNPENPSEPDNDTVTDNDTVKEEYIYSNFYDLEIEKSNNDQSYLKIVKTLFGENNLKRKLNGVLKIESQLSFDEFKILLPQSASNGKSIIDMLENMENGKYYKNKVSVYRTLLTWIKR